jgi:DNA invertase Pin-like site-specific DNA recombinase
MNIPTTYPKGTKFVLSARVSTKNQLNSNLKSSSSKDETSLSLEHQLEGGRNWISSVEGVLLQEFVDVDTGGKRDREGISNAIKLCHEKSATLVVSDLSRFSRGGLSVVVEMERLKIDFIEYTSPYDSQVMKEIKLTLARQELRDIKTRIKRSKDQIQSYIDRDGFYVTKKGDTVYKQGQEKYLNPKKAALRSAEVRRNKALTDPNNILATGYIISLRKNGETFDSIAKTLNKGGYQTSRGNQFSKTQVKILFDRSLTLESNFQNT